MHDVLRTRLLRKLESLPEEQVYQVLDYIEFLETKYARDVTEEASGLQRLAEKLEDQLRRRAMSPSSLREAFQLISAADKVLSNVSKVGKDLLGEMNGSQDSKGPKGSSKPAKSPGGEKDQPGKEVGGIKPLRKGPGSGLGAPPPAEG